MRPEGFTFQERALVPGTWSGVHVYTHVLDNQMHGAFCGRAGGWGPWRGKARYMHGLQERRGAACEAQGEGELGSDSL